VVDLEKGMGQKSLTDERCTIDRKARETQNGHRAAVLWMTGFSGSGKSTLANALESALFDRGCRVVVLDGDALRNGICSDLSFSLDDRSENIRRAGEIARLFLENGLIVIAAFISPLRSDRELARNLFADGDFLELHCDASFEVCEQRDVKGLYKRARAGEIPHFTGLTSPYEPPEAPEFRVKTGEWSVATSLKWILEGLEGRGILSSRES
jgi:adenylylsulfate kinase